MSQNPNPNPNSPNTGGLPFKLDGKTIAIGLIVIVVVIFLAGRLFGGGDDNNNAPLNNDTVNPTQVQSEPVEDDGIELGNVVIATSIDDDFCPEDVVDAFEPSTLPFYAVAPNSTVVEGTTVFARLSRGNENLEDAAEITAPDDLNDVCIVFEFDPRNLTLEPGDYQIEFFVNGNAADSVQFEIR